MREEKEDPLGVFIENGFDTMKTMWQETQTYSKVWYITIWTFFMQVSYSYGKTGNKKK